MATVYWPFLSSGENNTASNLGGGAGVFAGKVGADLQFKSLVAGTNIILTPSGTEILIDATGGGGTLAQTLALGNVSGANDILIDEGQVLSNNANGNSRIDLSYSFSDGEEIEIYTDDSFNGGTTFNRLVLSPYNPIWESNDGVNNHLLEFNNSSSSFALAITSTTKGFVMPRLTTTQRNAISLPLKSLIVFNTITNQFEYNSGTPVSPVWVGLSDTNLGNTNLTLSGNRTVTYGGNSLFLNGNTAIGDTAIPASTRFFIKSSGSTPGTVALSIENVSSAGLLTIRDDASFGFGSVPQADLQYYLHKPSSTLRHGLLLQHVSSNVNDGYAAYIQNTGTSANVNNALQLLASGGSFANYALNIQGGDAYLGAADTKLIIASSHAGVGQAEIALRGTGLTRGLFISSQKTSGTNYGIYSQNTATSSGTNVAGLFEATNGVGNYAIIVPSGGGDVGIGNSAPTQRLDVTGNVKFGAATNARIIARSEHTSAPGGTLATGEWEMSLYDDGVSPVFRIRYNDGGVEKTGDVPLV